MSACDLKPLTVLIVDDNAHMRIILMQILQSLGVRRMIEASDGGQALEAFRRHEIDLIFTDLMMAPIDGLAFIHWVRHADASPNPYVPIIMVTGHATRRSLDDARMAGVTEFLAKPLNARGVLHRVNEVINNPRDFVRAPGYFGPCRRRRIDHDFTGTERRGVVDQAPVDLGGFVDDEITDMAPEDIY